QRRPRRNCPLTSKRSSIHDTAGGWRSCVHLRNSGELSRTAFTPSSSEATPSSAQRPEHITEQHPSIWWQALNSRDQRFDGRFFIGAATARIYCRPICPVPFARPNNLVWFPSAAAAEEAGYRPCRRCHPETSPGTPAWLGTSAIVSRALTLISEGALDESSVEDLADRVGVGSRQLRRLFVEHLGASPVKVAITHRVHFARNLIEET